MQAGEREFRYRFWIFFGLFWAAFFCYWVDHVNTAEWLLRRLAPALDLDSPRGRHALQALFGFGAALAALGAWIRTWATAYLRSDVVHDGAVA